MSAGPKAKRRLPKAKGHACIVSIRPTVSMGIIYSHFFYPETHGPCCPHDVFPAISAHCFFIPNLAPFMQFIHTKRNIGRRFTPPRLFCQDRRSSVHVTPPWVGLRFFPVPTRHSNLQAVSSACPTRHQHPHKIRLRCIPPCTGAPLFWPTAHMTAIGHAVRPPEPCKETLPLACLALFPDPVFISWQKWYNVPASQFVWLSYNEGDQS